MELITRDSVSCVEESVWGRERVKVMRSSSAHCLQVLSAKLTSCCPVLVTRHSYILRNYYELNIAAGVSYTVEAVVLIYMQISQ